MNLKKTISLLILSILCIVSSSPIHAASKPYIVPENAYLSSALSVFVDGKLIVLREKTHSIDGIKNPDIYVPIKLLGKLKNVKVSYNKPITVSSDHGTFKIDSSNSVLFENSTYISLEKLQKFTGFKAKNDYDAKSLFLWSGTEGEKESKRLMSQLNKISNDYLKSYMGKKVYIYDGEKMGWVKELRNFSAGNFVEAIIQLNDGTIYEDLIVGDRPDSFCSYDDFESINGYFSGKYYWANKNVLPLSNPLGHLEKVYFRSVKMQGSNLIIQAKRSNGANQTFKLSFFSDYSSPINEGFFTVNPKTTYPGWSSDIWAKITKQKISIGMTPQQVLLSWGGPKNINSYNRSNLRIEQWVYGSTYLYFYNGKLESWTD